MGINGVQERDSRGERMFHVSAWSPMKTPYGWIIIGADWTGLTNNVGIRRPTEAMLDGYVV